MKNGAPVEDSPGDSGNLEVPVKRGRGRPPKKDGNVGVQPNKLTSGLGSGGKPAATSAQTKTTPAQIKTAPAHTKSTLAQTRKATLAQTRMPPENTLPDTPSNKDKSKPGGGSTQKTPIANNGSSPLMPPTLGNGKVQKRPISEYLEDVSNAQAQEQEREHKKPAQRQWVDPGQIRRPLNNLPVSSYFHQDIRKNYNDPEIMRLTGPEGSSDPLQIDLAQLYPECFRLDFEPSPTRLQLSSPSPFQFEPSPAPPQVESSPKPLFGFPGLPQYKPPAKANPKAAATKPVSDCFPIHQQHFKHLDEKIKTGVELDEGLIEEHRLRSMFVKLMGDQKRDLKEMNAKPLVTKPFQTSFELTEHERSSLALMMLKPAIVKKIDPPLFAEGTWHNSRRMEDEDATCCSFCTFDCDFGVRDERVWLPVEASGVFCRECHEATMTSVYEYEFKFQQDRDVRQASREDPKRSYELSTAAATPPLKELADSGNFKIQSLQHRELRNESVHERRQAKLDQLKGNEVAQLFGEQVLNAFRGTGGQMVPMVPRNVHNPQPVSPTIVLNTFKKEDIQRIEAYVGSMAPLQRHQFKEHVRSLDANGQWHLFQQCSKLAQSSNAPKGMINSQAMATLAGQLKPDQQRFMMQNMSQAARGHLSPMIEGGSFGPPQLVNSGTAGHNHQRSFSNGSTISNGSQLSTLQHSTQTTSSTTGVPDVQYMGTTARGHQRSSSYTGLPPSSPQTLVGFGGAGSGQNNPQNGPGGVPLNASMANQRMPVNDNPHRRNTSMPHPPEAMMHNGNTGSGSPPNGWPTKGIASSPPMQPSMPNGPKFGNINYLQRRTGDGSMLPRSSPPADGNWSPSTQRDSNSSPPGAANNSNQSQFSNRGNNPLPHEALANKQSVHAIQLTLSGGTIGPTTFLKDIPANTPATTRFVYHQLSDAQLAMQNASGLASSPVSHAQGLEKPSARPLPPGNNTQAPAPLHGLGISNGQVMMGGASSNVNIAYPGSPSMNGTPNALQRPQANTPGAYTLRMSPPNLQSNHSTPTTSRFPTNQPQAYPHPPALHHAHTAPLNSGSMAPPQAVELRRAATQPNLQISPKYQKLLFCRGCPWRQIDITKARICEGCKAEKLKIILHKHLIFRPLHRGVDFERGEGVGHGQLADTKSRTCMVCTGLATDKCTDCPLKLCTHCHVTLTTQCKFPSPLRPMAEDPLTI